MYSYFDATPPGPTGQPLTTWTGFGLGYDPNVGTMIDVFYPADPNSITQSTPRKDGWLTNPITGDPITAAQFASVGITVPYVGVPVASGKFPLVIFFEGGTDSIQESPQAPYLASLGQIVIAPRAFQTDYVTNGAGAMVMRATIGNRAIETVIGFNNDAASIFHNHINSKRVMAAGWSYGGAISVILSGGDASLGIAPNPRITSVLGLDPSAWLFNFTELQIGNRLPTMCFSSDALSGIMYHYRGFASNPNPSRFFFKITNMLHGQFGPQLCNLGTLSDNLGFSAYDYSWALPGQLIGYECDPNNAPSSVKLGPWADYAVALRIQQKYMSIFVGIYQYDQWELLPLLTIPAVYADHDNRAGNFLYRAGNVCGDQVWAGKSTAEEMIYQYDDYNFVGPFGSTFGPSNLVGFVESGFDKVDAPPFHYFEGQPTFIEWLTTPGCLFPL